MKLTKLLAAVATIAIVSEITRRIVEEYEYRKINEELFGRNEEEEAVNLLKNYGNKPIDIKKLKKEEDRKQAIKALKVEQDYHLATIQYAIYEMYEPEIVTEAKARLIEIHNELESLK